MRPGRMCDGISLLAVGFFLCGFFLNEPAALVPVAGIILLLGADALILLRKAQTLCAGLKITRTTPDRYARVGSIQKVTFLAEIGDSIKKSADSGLTIQIRDLLPIGAVPVSGNTRGEPGTSISHTFQSLVTGAIRPEGVEVIIKDVFFSTSIRLSRPIDCEPRFVVLPLPEEWESLRPGFGTREAEKRGLLSGSNVLWFRKFAEGDSLRSVDWKMSAKYDTRYVRECGGQFGGFPLFIIDLPEFGEDKGLEKIRRSALSALSGTTSEQGAVLLISGGNLIRFIPFSHATNLIDEVTPYLNPVARFTSYYRYFSSRRLVSFVDANTEFSSTIQTITNSFGGKKQIPLFARQITSALEMAPNADCVLFTTGIGDISHLEMIGRIAAQGRIPVRFVVPQELLQDAARKILLSTGAAVEVCR